MSPRDLYITPQPLDNLPYAVSRYVCDFKFEGWRRTNRNNRIAKKWRKRYGPKMVCHGRYVMVNGSSLLLCPHSERAIKLNPQVSTCRTPSK